MLAKFRIVVRRVLGGGKGFEIKVRMVSEAPPVRTSSSKDYFILGAQRFELEVQRFERVVRSFERLVRRISVDPKVSNVLFEVSNVLFEEFPRVRKSFKLQT